MLCKQTDDLSVRDFADYYVIPKDVATGSSNGYLTAYLLKYRFCGNRKKKYAC